MWPMEPQHCPGMMRLLLWVIDSWWELAKKNIAVGIFEKYWDIVVKPKPQKCY